MHFNSFVQSLHEFYKNGFPIFIKFQQPISKPVCLKCLLFFSFNIYKNEFILVFKMLQYLEIL